MILGGQSTVESTLPTRSETSPAVVLAERSSTGELCYGYWFHRATVQPCQHGKSIQRR